MMHSAIRICLAAALALGALPVMAASPRDVYAEPFVPGHQALTPARVVHDGAPYAEAFYTPPVVERPTLPALASGAPYTEAFFTPPAVPTSTSQDSKGQMAKCVCPCPGHAG